MHMKNVYRVCGLLKSFQSSVGVGEGFNNPHNWRSSAESSNASACHIFFSYVVIVSHDEESDFKSDGFSEILCLFITYFLFAVTFGNRTSH